MLRNHTEWKGSIVLTEAATEVMRAVILAAVAVTLNASSSFAAEGGEANDEHEAHHLAVFVGGTTPTKAGNATVVALGVAYERRFTELWGLEALADFGIGDHERTALFAAGPTVRPFSLLGEMSSWVWLSPLKLGVGAGVELVEKNSKTTTHAIVGIGAGYEFHVGWLSVAPTVYVDFVGETKTNISYGLYLGSSF